MSSSKSRSGIILDRLRAVLGVATDTEMAQIIGVAQSTYAGWKARDTADLLRVISVCDSYKIDWNQIFEGTANSRTSQIPLFLCPAPAGSPTPATDEIEAVLSCGDIIPRPEKCFACRVTGDSMIGAGIESGDTLIVERRENSQDGDIVVCSLNGELTVKRLRRLDGGTYLYPENERYQAIKVHEGDSLTIWGSVVRSIKGLYRAF